jgi:hypothetical protein
MTKPCHVPHSPQLCLNYDGKACVVSKLIKVSDVCQSFLSCIQQCLSHSQNKLSSQKQEGSNLHCSVPMCVVFAQFCTKLSELYALLVRTPKLAKQALSRPAATSKPSLCITYKILSARA